MSNVGRLYDYFRMTASYSPGGPSLTGSEVENTIDVAKEDDGKLDKAEKQAIAMGVARNIAFYGDNGDARDTFDQLQKKYGLPELPQYTERDARVADVVAGLTSEGHRPISDAVRPVELANVAPSARAAVKNALDEINDMPLLKGLDTHTQIFEVRGLDHEPLGYSVRAQSWPKQGPGEMIENSIGISQDGRRLLDERSPY